MQQPQKFIMKNPSLTLVALLAAVATTACVTTETVRVIESPKVKANAAPYAGARVQVALGKFDNQSSFQRGIFGDGVDRLGSQARTNLAAHLNLTNRFDVMDRENMDEAKREQALQSIDFKAQGAKFLVTGSVTEFGRKEVGDQQFFGILGRGKQQIAYSKVTLNLVDTTTSRIVYSAQGAGEYALSNREIIGFGSTSSYDFTLNGKVLDLAIREAVDKLVPFVEMSNK